MESKNNKMANELMIDIKDFFWRLLEQWKAVLLVAICVMVAFLGFLHIRYSNNIKEKKEAQNITQQITMQDILKTLPEQERSAVVSVYRLWQEREQASEYICSAPIMQIDPNHAKRLRASWAVSKTDKEINMIDMSYAVEIQSENCIKALVRAGGIELKSDSFSDLVFITYPSELGQEIVCLDVFLTDEMQEESVQKELQHQIEEAHNQLQKEFGNHEIINYKSELAVVSDERVYEKQVSALKRFSDISSQVNSLKNMLSNEQKDALVKLQQMEVEPTATKEASIAPKAITPRNVLIGFVLGILIYAGLFLLYIIISNRVFSVRVLEEKASIRNLGEWHDSTRITNNALIKDYSIWQRHHFRSLDKEAEINKITHILENVCKHKRISSLLFSLVGEPSILQEGFIKELSQKLKEKGFNVKQTKSGNLDDSVIMDADGVVVAVIDSRTEFKDLGVLFDRCYDYEKPIIGSVYLG